MFQTVAPVAPVIMSGGRASATAAYMKKIVGMLATIVVCLRAYTAFGMDQALAPAGGGGRRPNIGGVGAVVALAMDDHQFGQIPQAQPIFAQSLQRVRMPPKMTRAAPTARQRTKPVRDTNTSRALGALRAQRRRDR